MKLPKSYIKKYGISKTAWSKYKASLKGGKSRTTSKGRKSPKRKTRRKIGGRTLGKRRSFLSTSTIFRFVRLGALLGPAVARYSRYGGGTEGVKGAFLGFAGMDSNGNFAGYRLKEAWLPYIATSLITVGVQKLNGIIRRL